MRIRLARLEDASDIAAMNREDLGYTFSQEDTRENIKTILFSPQCKLFVAVDNDTDTIMGYVHAMDYAITYSAPLKLVCSLAVGSAYRGRGVGKKLMQTVEDWAKSTGAAGLRLSSQVKRTQAHTFYEHLGFTHAKTQKTFIKYFPQSV